MMTTQDAKTPLQRANDIAAKFYMDDAYFKAFVEGIRAGEYREGLNNNPHDETTDPVQWAGWYRGYYRVLQAQES